MIGALRWLGAALLLVWGCLSDSAGKDTGAPDDGSDGVDCATSKVGPPVIRRLTNAQYENTIIDVFPEISDAWLGVRLGAAPLSELGFTTDNETLRVGTQIAKEILETAEDVGELVTQPHNLSVVLPCATASPDLACAETFIATVGPRLFRRPLSATETNAYLELHTSVATESDFALGIKWTLVALLQSPHTVYRFELGEATDGAYHLTRSEIVSELSYTYAGSPPSAELIALGESGALDDPAVRVEQARELMQTPRGREIVQQFVDEWIRYSIIRSKAREDVEDFASISELLIDEIRAFVEEVLYTRNGSLGDLLTADFAIASDELRQFYGWEGASGEVVQRPDNWGVGLLAQGAFLASHAHMAYTSPTLRGLTVYRRFLCREVDSPPAEVPAFEPPVPGEKTTRHHLEDHTANGYCQNCHASFDPTGYTFEHFDETGRYRADESGLAIDAQGSIAFASETVNVDGMRETAEALTVHPEVEHCVTRLIAAYSYGGERGSQCSLDSPRAALAAGQIGLVGFWAELAGTDHFVRRDFD